MGHAFQDELDLFARVEAAEVFLEFTKEPVGHSMRFKKVMGRFPGRFGSLARVDASEVLLDFAQCGS